MTVDYKCALQLLLSHVFQLAMNTFFHGENDGNQNIFMRKSRDNFLKTILKHLISMD